MADLILFNKPFQVLSQFTTNDEKQTLSHFITTQGVYPAGRLDYDSEGLLLLTNNGALQHQISHPKHKLPKTYWVQVDGRITDEALTKLSSGIQLKDGMTKPAKATRIDEPDIWPRTPPVRFRQNQPTSWISLTISEGKNRQVRRMTAAAGFPTLRLIRARIGNWSLETLQPGEFRTLSIHMPETAETTPKRTAKRRSGNSGRKKIRQPRSFR